MDGNYLLVISLQEDLPIGASVLGIEGLVIVHKCFGCCK
jgi:hypothetical protein